MLTPVLAMFRIPISFLHRDYSHRVLWALILGQVFFLSDLVQGQGAGTEKRLSLSQISVESIQFEDAELTSVLEYLSIRARELKGHPSNFVLYDPEGHFENEVPGISLSLRNIPLSQVVKYVCNLSETSLLVDPHAAVIGRAADLKNLREARAQQPSSSLSSNPQWRQLAQIPVPSIALVDTPLETALEFLRLKAWELGDSTAPPNFIFRPSPWQDAPRRTITLDLADVSLFTCLQYITELSGAGFRLDSRAVVVGVPGFLTAPSPVLAANNSDLALLSSGVIEEVSIENASLKELLPVVRHYALEASSGREPNFVTLAKSDRVATLHLRKVSALDLLRYSTELTYTNFRVDPQVITIIDQPPPTRPKAKDDSSR